MRYARISKNLAILFRGLPRVTLAKVFGSFQSGSPTLKVAQAARPIGWHKHPPHTRQQTQIRARQHSPTHTQPISCLSNSLVDLGKKACVHQFVRWLVRFANVLSRTRKKLNFTAPCSLFDQQIQTKLTQHNLQLQLLVVCVENLQFQPPV